MIEYKTEKELKEFCKQKVVLPKLHSMRILLGHVANEFESKDKEIDAISMEAARIAEEIHNLHNEIRKVINRKEIERSG